MFWFERSPKCVQLPILPLASPWEGNDHAKDTVPAVAHVQVTGMYNSPKILVNKYIEKSRQIKICIFMIDQCSIYHHVLHIFPQFKLVKTRVQRCVYKGVWKSALSAWAKTSFCLLHRTTIISESCERHGESRMGWRSLPLADGTYKHLIKFNIRSRFQAMRWQELTWVEMSWHE